MSLIPALRRQNVENRSQNQVKQKLGRLECSSAGQQVPRMCKALGSIPSTISKNKETDFLVSNPGKQVYLWCLQIASLRF